MDIFNKKRIAELERIIEKQEIELENFRREKDKKSSGEPSKEEHKTGVWCEGCKNAISYNTYGAFGTYRFCLLDNECKDRKV